MRTGDPGHDQGGGTGGRNVGIEAPRRSGRLHARHRRSGPLGHRVLDNYDIAEVPRVGNRRIDDLAGTAIEAGRDGPVRDQAHGRPWQHETVRDSQIHNQRNAVHVRRLEADPSAGDWRKVSTHKRGSCYGSCLRHSRAGKPQKYDRENSPHSAPC